MPDGTVCLDAWEALRGACMSLRPAPPPRLTRRRPGIYRAYVVGARPSDIGTSSGARTDETFTASRGGHPCQLLPASLRARRGAAELFTPAFCDYLACMHDAFAPRVAAARDDRATASRRALHEKQPPASLPQSDVNTKPWQVPPVPADLRKPGIEITGPVSITGMFIHALNPGPEGVRAEGDLDDDEDSAGHRLIDTVRAAHNRVRAVGGHPLLSRQ